MLLVSGCSIAPGMKMDEPAKLPGGPVIRVQPITVPMLKEQEARRETIARKVADEFATEHEAYRIGPGDVLHVTVWDHPELTIPAGSFRDAETSGQQVDDRGRMYYPYIGVVMAAGMTVSELRVLLAGELSKYIQDPQLDVRVVAFRSKKVYVVGEVHDPGVIPIDDTPLLITDAIARSGGLTPNAHKTGINVSRDGRVFEIDLKALFDHADSSQNLMLKPGDIINVPDRSQQKVFVMGEVRAPQSVDIVNGRLSLAAALGEVGGVSQISANSGGVYVIRGSDRDNPEIFHLDARYATGLLLAERFEMQAQDIVFVDTAEISQWNRVISQLLPTFSVINVADNLSGR